MTDLRLYIPDRDKERLKVMFLAKHALSDGRPDSDDGVHAVYHHELRQTLEGLGLNLKIGTSYADLFAEPDYDFLFTMLNRGGFKNSEMFGPLFAVWRNVPFTGASPILRGLGDDKHLMKLCARSRGVKTPDSQIYRLGSVLQEPPNFGSEYMVVKPNASSASWGIKKVASWDEAKEHIEYLYSVGHDAIVEAYHMGLEYAVPVVPGGDGGPAYLQVMQYPRMSTKIRTYEEKRELVTVPANEQMEEPVEDPEMCRRLKEAAHKLMPEIWPFDFGRFEFKVDPETDEIIFIEVNMSCNLWSRKAISQAWQSMGYAHHELIETIIAGSMMRQGLIAPQTASHGTSNRRAAQ